MNNRTTDMPMTSSFFRRYLLGESFRNILIRLTVIASAIILVWCGIMLALIVHMKCQRTKQMQKTSNNQQLYGNRTSLQKTQSNRSECQAHYQSPASPPAQRCCSIVRFLSQLKRCCIFWPSAAPSNRITIERPSSLTVRDQRMKSGPNSSMSRSSRVQFAIQAMSRKPLGSTSRTLETGRKVGLLYRDRNSSASDESRILHWFENESKQSSAKKQNGPGKSVQIEEVCRKASSTRDRRAFCFSLQRQLGSHVHYPSISLPIDPKRTGYQPSKERLEQIHQFNTKATLFFHPITRRLSTVHAHSCLPTADTIEGQCRPHLLVSSARELTRGHDWKWYPTSSNDPIRATDTSRLSSSARHIPLVMITDTSSSNTNIVELETYEDKRCFLGDIERRLSRELRATYRPRHST